MMITVLPQLSVGPKLAPPKDRDVHIFILPSTGGDGDHIADPITFDAGPAVLPKSTDIIVLNGEPRHFAGGALLPHDQAHKQFPQTTILQLSRRQENQAVWWSEEPFSIDSIGPSHLDHNGAGPYPFVQTPPLTAVVERDLLDGQDIYVVRSGVHSPEADNHMYKIVFTIRGEKIDPDMSCNP